MGTLKDFSYAQIWFSLCLGLGALAPLAYGAAPSNASGKLACSKVEDLSGDLGPVYNQASDLNSCFASAGADMLTQMMHKTKELDLGDRIQPLALWALYELDNGRAPNLNKDDISTPAMLFESLKGLQTRELNMLCKQSEFGSGDNTLHPLFAEADAAAQKRRLEMEQSKPCRLKTNSAADLKSIRGAIYDTWWNAIKEKCHTPVPHFNWDWFGYTEARFEKLKKNRSGPWPKIQNEVLASEIDAKLRGGTLVAANYQASFMQHKKPGAKSGEAFMHVSSIVASEMREGRCFYKIRDSFGAGCERYEDKKNCGSDGNLWVDQEVFLNHTNTIFSVRPEQRPKRNEN